MTRGSCSGCGLRGGRHMDDCPRRPAVVRETVTVTTKTTVDGTKPKRKQSRGSNSNTRRVIQDTLSLDQCTPEVQAMVRQTRKPGQKIRVVSPTEVWLVNR